MARMKKRISWQTENCIKCGKPAKVWGGAVRFSGNQWVLAGWCKRCERNGLNWFHGDYSPRYGRIPTT